MNEAIKLPLTLSLCQKEIVDAEGDIFAYLSSKICNCCKCVPRPVLWFGKRASQIILSINCHDDLLFACRDLASIQGKIPNFPGSAFLEISRDLARAAIAKVERAQ